MATLSLSCHSLCHKDIMALKISLETWDDNGYRGNGYREREKKTNTFFSDHLYLRKMKFRCWKFRNSFIIVIITIILIRVRIIQQTSLATKIDDFFLTLWGRDVIENVFYMTFCCLYSVRLPGLFLSSLLFTRKIQRKEKNKEGKKGENVTVMIFLSWRTLITRIWDRIPDIWAF